MMHVVKQFVRVQLCLKQWRHFSSASHDKFTGKLATSGADTAALLPGRDEFAKMVQDATDLIISDVYDNESSPVGGTGYEWLHSHNMTEMNAVRDIYNRFRSDPLPMDGYQDKENIKPVLEEYFQYINDSTLENQPGYMAFVPTGGLPVSSIAQLVSSATNRYSTITMAAPAAAGIEECVVQWIAELIGMKKNKNVNGTNYGTSCGNYNAYERKDNLNTIDINSTDDSCTSNVDSNVNVGGVLTSGASMATLLAIHAAREKCLNGNNSSCGNVKYNKNINSDSYIDYTNSTVLDLTIYVSEQSHYCIDQTARICGIPIENVRYIPSNKDTCQMRYDLIESMIEKDISKGLKPFMICAMAGTVYSGAVDDLNKVSNIANKYNLWYHIDGAWGGLFAATKSGNKYFNGISNADSIVIDPHKTLFIPYGVGCLIVKNKQLLKQANSFTGACMHQGMPFEMPDDIMDYSFELTRNFRGLDVWLPLKLYGVQYFVDELENKIQLTKYCVEQLKNKLECIQIKHDPPPLSVFAFQINLNKLKNKFKCGKYDFVNEKILDEMNKLFLDNINKRGRILLSPFKSINNIKGEFYLRVAILSFRTQLKHVNYAIEDITDAYYETIDNFETHYIVDDTHVLTDMNHNLNRPIRSTFD